MITPPTFPNGAHFEDVGPTLEANGLRGTFNNTIARASVMEHAPEWRAMAARGHELGNHSLFQACRSTVEDPKPWVGPYNLVDYDERRLRDELQVANFALSSIAGRTERTYAKPCWHTTIGSGAEERPIEPIPAELFLAARGRLNHCPVDLAHLDYMSLDSASADRRLDHIHPAWCRRWHPQPFYRL